ncbi:PTS sugar transporter subunit IIB [Oenococcus oeni]|uniref:PTS sugar transporter subunit IIB n=1 Tax=Oenococcus oeni TaxID=1247 RepID=UPI003EE5131E
MLVCAAGMSTSLLVSKMQKAAKEQGEDVDIFATAASDADNKLESEQPDILMLGPQVGYMLSQFKEKVKIPVEVINMQDYGLMNGEKVLNQALKEIG